MTCGTAVVLEHNGDLYACDHYVPAGHLLGNIAQGRTLLEVLTSPQRPCSAGAKLDALLSCFRGCDVRLAFSGGRTKDRFLTTPDGEPG